MYHITGSVTPKVPHLCSPCLFTFGRGLLLHLNHPGLAEMQSWLTFRYSKSPLHDVHKDGEQSHGTFGVILPVRAMVGKSSGFQIQIRSWKKSSNLNLNPNPDSDLPTIDKTSWIFNVCRSMWIYKKKTNYWHWSKICLNSDLCRFMCINSDQ